VEGRDFAFDLRYLGTSGDELERVVADLLALRPNVIVIVGSPAAWAAKKATSTIPIVMATVGDPRRIGARCRKRAKVGDGLGFSSGGPSLILLGWRRQGRRRSSDMTGWRK